MAILKEHVLLSLLLAEGKERDKRTFEDEDMLLYALFLEQTMNTTTYDYIHTYIHTYYCLLDLTLLLLFLQLTHRYPQSAQKSNDALKLNQPLM